MRRVSVAGWPASDDGRLSLNDTTVNEVAAGPETVIAALLARYGDKPTDELGPLLSSGDGSTLVANVDFGDRTGESNWVAGCALPDEK
jgi:hypothetical protein